MKNLACILLFLPLIACGEAIDPDSLPVSIEGYEDWERIEPLLGPVGGHADTYRIMYRNEVAKGYTGAGEYPLGTAIVKEIYELDGDDGKGAFLYAAVMRRIDGEEHPGLPLNGGWLFTQIKDGDDEIQNDSCWESCHRAAPYLGAFFDHGY